MDNNILKSNQQTYKIAKVSLLLGIVSLLVLTASIVVGILVKPLGIVSFLSVASIFALGAIICGIIARKKSIKEKLQGKRIENFGIAFGMISLFLNLFLRIAIFIFFIPWLGA